MLSLFPRLTFIIIYIFFLSSCSFFYGLVNNNSSVINDSAPNILLDTNKIIDAVPKIEPKSRRGNPNEYVQFGTTYKVMKSATGYKERGDASWYGTKFHGKETSNGERYNMYLMTAAHKSLPLPTYLKVTNLENGYQIIVRVNDRGPFHPGRIIDLSYAAATKLDILKKGTAKVEVEAINPKVWKKKMSNNKMNLATYPKLFLQAGAFRSEGSAISMKNNILDILMNEDIIKNISVSVKEFDDGIHRILIGPFLNKEDALFIKNHVRMRSFGNLLFLFD